MRWASRNSPDGGITFGEPGPLVQELADIEERADGDLAQSHAEVGQFLALDVEHLGDLGIATLQDRVVGDPDDDVVRRRDRALPTIRNRTGVDVGGVGTGHRAQYEGRVAGGEGEHRDAVERSAGGDDPVVLTNPRVGLHPTMLPNAAGTRPEPAVSVPRANGTRPAATATPEPELDPPGTTAGSNGLRGVP